MKILRILDSLFKPSPVFAHCDIPCGIYDLTPAKIAAMTVLRMVKQIQELSAGGDHHQGSSEYLNMVTRRITVKEQHAQMCKNELYILWSDFFKAEHLEKYPHLHDLFWKAAKLCSKNKQEIDEVAAQDLVKAVDEIAKIFYEVKRDPKRFESYKDVTDKLF